MEIPNKVFFNKLKLKLNDKNIESQYEKLMNLKIKKLTIIYSSLLTIFTVAFSVLIVMDFEKYLYKPIVAIYYMSISLSVSLIVMTITAFACYNKVKVLKCINFFLFFAMSLCFGCLRYHVINTLGADCVVYMGLSIMEFLIRIGYVFQGTLNFLESSSLILASCFSYWLFFPFFTNWSIIWYRILIFNVLFLFEAVINYFYLYQKKENFYHQKKAELLCHWYINIFNNMNTGFLSIKNNKISYTNRAILDMIFKFKNTNEMLEDFKVKESEIHLNNNNNNNSNILTNSDKILFFLLNDVNFNSCLENSNLINTTKNQSSILTILKQYKKEIIKSKKENEFVNFGIKNFNDLTNYNSLSFEIYCRFNRDEEDNETFDFIFNDVSKTQLIMEQKADVKYKSIFLSKIAHEFKNPLLCIIELANQAIDSINNNSPLSNNIKNKSNSSKSVDNYIKINTHVNSKEQKEVIEAVSTLKALSKYLLYLIQDLDFISNKNKVVEKSEVNINEILQFFKEITTGLLKNSQKMDQIRFNCFNKLPSVITEVHTDETKLKQILLNLITNSVKFTQKGFINLTVERKEHLIYFSVEDSGVGFNVCDDLFKPRLKGYSSESTTDDINKGSGLGLAIVKELSSLIGPGLEYKSNNNAGSKFGFYIPFLNDSCLNESYDNNIEMNNYKYLKFGNKSPYVRSISKPSQFMERCVTNNDEEINAGITQKVVKEIIMNTINDCDSSNSSNETKKIESLVLFIPKNKKISSDNLLSNSSPSILIKDPGIVPSEFDLFNLNNMIQDNQFGNNSSLSYSNLNLVDLKYNIDITYKNLNRDDSINIIVADDEKYTRQATIRIIKKFASANNLIINIIEAQDGIETLYFLIKVLAKGIKISLIISDETMLYMKGSESALIVKNNCLRKNEFIPFVIVTAYEDPETLKRINNKFINSIFSKPLDKHKIQKIFETFKLF